MNTSFRFLSALLASSALLVPARAADFAPPTSEWKSLFNGRDLTGWDKFLATDKGTAPLEPNVDPKGVFTVTSEKGENVIHVSGDGYGAITTQDEFTNFHFRVQFKWGMGRFGGRANVGRDSGILSPARMLMQRSRRRLRGSRLLK